LTAAFNSNNAEHVAAKRNVEVGNGLPGIRTTAEVDAALQEAGFEVRTCTHQHSTARHCAHSDLDMCAQPRVPSVVDVQMKTPKSGCVHAHAMVHHGVSVWSLDGLQALLPVLCPGFVSCLTCNLACPVVG
jgi:hypothetical protein